MIYLFASEMECPCFITILQHKFSYIANLQILSKGRFKVKKAPFLPLKSSFKIH